MIRSMAASMAPSGSWRFSCRVWELRSGNRFGLGLRLEPDDGLVGEPDLVQFAVLEQLDDDLEQAFVGDQRVGNRAGAAEVIRGDGIGVAHEFDVHCLKPALDQHRILRSAVTTALRGTGSARLGHYFAVANDKT